MSQLRHFVALSVPGFALYSPAKSDSPVTSLQGNLKLLRRRKSIAGLFVGYVGCWMFIPADTMPGAVSLCRNATKPTVV